MSGLRRLGTKYFNMLDNEYLENSVLAYVWKFAERNVLVLNGN